MEEKERFEIVNENILRDNQENVGYVISKNTMVDWLNQQDKQIKELEQETYPAYKREHQRRAYLENVEIPELKQENQQLKQQLENEKNTSAELVSLIDAMRYEDPKINELEQRLQDLPKNILKDIQENFNWNQCCEIRKYYDQPYIWFNYDAFNDFLDTIFKKYGEENE